MAVINNLLIGLLASLIGVLPPGLINMYAVKVGFREGRKKALIFSAGVCVVVMLQTFFALVFARYIDRHPEVVDVLQKVALGIFISLTIYFFFIAKDTRREIKEKEERSKTGRFFTGMLVAVLNLLPLPYWVYISLTFAGFGWFSFSEPDLWFTVLGSGMGTFVALAIYIHFFRVKEEDRKERKFKVNMNYVIGAVTALISVITLFRILKEL